MSQIVYFSSTSETTHRFVQKPDFPATRIPLHAQDHALQVHDAYVLIVPTYGGGNAGGAVPKQAIRFLNDASNRAHLQGVIAAGNTNFGAAYGIAGDTIAAKCGVPHLYTFELMGTTDDVDRVNKGLTHLWQRLSLTPA
ncbi:MAG: class Ib ribonucleoside-diphosphate reductase assembly flavoprotein NrdI [Propioniciclava sp.]